jgi:hypothetical protein
MNPATMQLLAALIPLTEEVIVRGVNIVATFKADITAGQLAESLEKSKSANWPAVDFSGGR